VSAAVATVEVGGFTALAAGPADAPLALVLHGFPDAPPTFAPLLGALADRGYRVVAPWLRGYAPSPLAGPYDVDRLADDVLAWADRLSPTQPVALVGHDWGAAVTYVACARAPARFTAAVTLAVPHPAVFVRSLARRRQLARSWYMLAFQVPGVERLAAARDFALIDRLWADWSPGFTLPAELRAALHATLRTSWPAPLLYYRALTRPPGAALAAPASSRSHRGADPVPARRARRLHRPRGRRRRRALLHRRVSPRGRARRRALRGRRGADGDRRPDRGLARRSRAVTR
jgi:pimeloyl-ACP methyl ester carboxylesterase